MTTTMVRRARVEPAAATTRDERRVRGPRRAARRAGFTLVELLVASALSTMVLAGVLSVFLLVCRTGVRTSHYADMEAQSRVVLQLFGQDARQADSAVWVNAQTLRLTTGATQVTYRYEAAGGRFLRETAGGSRVLMTNIAGFRFLAYNLAGTSLDVAASPGAASTATKMVQVDIDLARSSASLARTTARAVSARYVLRNKPTL